VYSGYTGGLYYESGGIALHLNLTTGINHLEIRVDALPGYSTASLTAYVADSGTYNDASSNLCDCSTAMQTMTLVPGTILLMDIDYDPNQPNGPYTTCSFAAQ
jgi:hypothetical protein